MHVYIYVCGMCFADGIVMEGLVNNVAVLNDRGELLCAEEDCLEGSMARIVRIAALRWDHQ